MNIEYIEKLMLLNNFISFIGAEEIGKTYTSHNQFDSFFFAEMKNVTLNKKHNLACSIGPVGNSVSVFYTYLTVQTRKQWTMNFFLEKFENSYSFSYLDPVNSEKIAVQFYNGEELSAVFDKLNEGFEYLENKKSVFDLLPKELSPMRRSHDQYGRFI